MRYSPPDRLTGWRTCCGGRVRVGDWRWEVALRPAAVSVRVKLTLPNEYEVGNQAEAVAVAEAEAEAEAESKTGQTGSTNAANFRLGDWAKRLIKSSSNAAVAQLLPPPTCSATLLDLDALKGADEHIEGLEAYNAVGNKKEDRSRWLGQRKACVDDCVQQPRAGTDAYQQFGGQRVRADRDVGEGHEQKWQHVLQIVAMGAGNEEKKEG